jgi:hypothetical protein
MIFICVISLLNGVVFGFFWGRLDNQKYWEHPDRFGSMNDMAAALYNYRELKRSTDLNSDITRVE